MEVLLRCPEAPEYGCINLGAVLCNVYEYTSYIWYSAKVTELMAYFSTIICCHCDYDGPVLKWLVLIRSSDPMAIACDPMAIACEPMAIV